MSNAATVKISIVIPAYKVKNPILQVIGDIGSDVAKIYVEDNYSRE